MVDSYTFVMSDYFVTDSVGPSNRFLMKLDKKVRRGQQLTAGNLYSLKHNLRFYSPKEITLLSEILAKQDNDYSEQVKQELLINDEINNETKEANAYQQIKQIIHVLIYEIVPLAALPTEEHKQTNDLLLLKYNSETTNIYTNLIQIFRKIFSSNILLWSLNSYGHLDKFISLITKHYDYDLIIQMTEYLNSLTEPIRTEPERYENKSYYPMTAIDKLIRRSNDELIHNQNFYEQYLRNQAIKMEIDADLPDSWLAEIIDPPLLNLPYQDYTIWPPQ